MTVKNLISMQKQSTTALSDSLLSKDWQLLIPDESIMDDSKYDYDYILYSATILNKESFEPYQFQSIEILQSYEYENRLIYHTDTSQLKRILLEMYVLKFKEVLQKNDINSITYRNSKYEICITVNNEEAVSIMIHNFVEIESRKTN
jgi:hypothetical protein